jgi:CheY-like chemotaxis protein
MTQRSVQIITDERAEGTRDEARESNVPMETPTNPGVRHDAKRIAPAAETGVLPAIILNGEGLDDSDTQDATRTTAETQVVSRPQPNISVKVGQRTALIVAENDAAAEAIQAALHRTNIQTVHESSAVRAALHFHDINPDIVLVDLTLPELTGMLENIHRRQRETGGRVPVFILIAQYGDPSIRNIGKVSGVHSYLVKPFTPADVERVVAGALNVIAR